MSDNLQKLVLAAATILGLGGNIYQQQNVPVADCSEWRETMNASVAMWREELRLERERH